MPLQLTENDWRALFPKAPSSIIQAFATQGHVLDRVGITESRTRLAFAVANVEHEAGGFAIKNLTENINYTAEGMAKVWPNRFASADVVRAKYGTKPGWQKRAFDDIYGARMGNREGTDDGSRYIGRGGPQITGRDGYREVGRRCGLDLVNNPDLTALPQHQPAILAAFWDWKGLAKLADAGNFKAFVKRWNGGNVGQKDREALLKGNDPVIGRLQSVVRAQSILDVLENILAGMDKEAA
ncbi:putative glycoside hydrolase [Rubellimicrobium mesophilum DSM 19309]|uniref:Putative glycoside hydrolase n=1 Tax=Rubellimicrobium mesophilum DSM 19309 TaxID=442562 RepID=A0A017HN01_9RHOB|nr:glycoside hydrolase family 19 protein [Rubellimicrobium mesophilum]EYD75756.1 putative glycoside hydrolase [Rubellimicrobium mesophilum DSM 19309]